MILKNISKKITKIFFSFLFVFLVPFFVLPTDDVFAACDGVAVEVGEDCDGLNFWPGDNCTTVGPFAWGGNLGCSGICTFNTSCCFALDPCNQDPTVTITPNAPSNTIGDVETYTVIVFNNDGNTCGFCPASRNFNLAMNINPSGVVDADGDPALIYETAFGSNPLAVAAQNSNSTIFDIKSDEGWGIGNYTFEVTVSEGLNSVTEPEIYHIGIIDVEICNNGIDDDGINGTDCADINCLGDPFCCGGNIIIDPPETCEKNGNLGCLNPSFPICNSDCTACLASPSSCPIGWGNCDEDLTTGVDGCETDLFDDAGNCGSCNNICKAGNCLSGKCPSLPSGGLIPCGRLKDNPATSWPDLQPCKICHVIILASEIINFLMGLVILVTILAIIVAGLIHVKTGGDSSLLLAAKQYMNKILFGFVVVFSVWVIVNTSMVLFGFNDPLGDGSWEKLDCDLGSFVYCGDNIVQNPNDLGEMEECEAGETEIDFAFRMAATAVGCVDGDGVCPDGCFNDDPHGTGATTDNNCGSTLGTWAIAVDRCNSSCRIACKGDPLEDKIGQGCFIGACQKGRYACDKEGGGVACLDVYSDPKYTSSPWFVGTPLFDYCCGGMAWDLADQGVVGGGMISPANIPFVVMKSNIGYPFRCQDVCATVGKVCVGVGLANPAISSCIYVIHDNGSNCNLPGNNAATNCNATFSRRRPCDCTSSGWCFGVRETACFCAF